MNRFFKYTVFSEAKLYYPLYSIDDKNLNWSSLEFFDRFYGGPYSMMMQQQQQQSPQEEQQQMDATNVGGGTPTGSKLFCKNLLL